MVAKRRVISKKSMNTCNCNPGIGLFSLILFAVGFWLLVNGVLLQWTTNAALSWWEVMLWYLVGFLALWLGKMSKMKAHGCCPVHGHCS